jgi:hypothetical protein
MDAIEFPEVNVILAKDQPEYVPLPVFVDGRDEMKPVTACFKLTPEELEEINRTGVLWYTQCTFGNAFHPVRMSTQNPFIHLEKIEP